MRRFKPVVRIGDRQSPMLAVFLLSPTWHLPGSSPLTPPVEENVYGGEMCEDHHDGVRYPIVFSEIRLDPASDKNKDNHQVNDTL
jgi:hypothetical protein